MSGGTKAFSIVSSGVSLRDNFDRVLCPILSYNPKKKKNQCSSCDVWAPLQNNWHGKNLTNHKKVELVRLLSTAPGNYRNIRMLCGHVTETEKWFRLIPYKAVSQASEQTWGILKRPSSDQDVCVAESLLAFNFNASECVAMGGCTSTALNWELVSFSSSLYSITNTCY